MLNFRIIVNFNNNMWLRCKNTYKQMNTADPSMVNFEIGVGHNIVWFYEGLDLKLNEVNINSIHAMCIQRNVIYGSQCLLPFITDRII